MKNRKTSGENMSSNAKGFTLLETVLAIALVLVVMLPLASLILQSHQAVHSSHNKLQALYLAQHILEEVRASEYQQVKSTSWQQVQAQPGWYYQLNVTVGEDQIKNITVVIRYPAEGSEQRLHLTSSKGLR